MSRFTGIPSIPEGVAGEWQYTLLESMKENIELLTGLRGERDRSSKAVVKSDLTISSAPRPRFSGVSASGGGFGLDLPGQPQVQVASLDDYQKLVNDVRLLSEDVRNLQQALDLLIRQLRR